MKTTYIYIKIHNITGLKYIGKTTRKDVEKYRGSGKYWKRHIKKHGYNCRTYVIRKFDDEQECKDFCLWFSKVNNIVISNKWANLIRENGLDGSNYWLGKSHTEEHKRKVSKNSAKYWLGKSGKDSPHYGVKHSEETRMKIGKSNKGYKKFLGKSHTEESKDKMRNVKRINVKCSHCGKEGNIAPMKRWHFDNCKFK